VQPEPPAGPVVIYDAGCGFCRRWAARLRQWDHAGRLTLLPLQDDRAPALAGRPRGELELALHAVLPSGEVLAGAVALRAICRYLPGGWLPRALLALPGALPVAERLYAYVARRWGPVGSRTDRR
jgi:predicted DCC family thiol-disulfide oxidoreductase YuxK